MTSFRIVQISDTHLSRVHPQFVGNYEVASDFANAHKPDLVIHSGDVAVEATARADDLLFAKEAMESLDAPYRVIAGNHDIGDNPGNGGYMPKKPVNAERIATHEALFGSSQWQLDAAGWSIIGVNAQLFLSGLAEEAAQEQWLDQMLSASNGKPVAMFCHKPLLLDAIEEPEDIPYRYVPMVPRRKLAALMEKANVQLFACGHVHQSRDHVVDGIRHVWGPATAFTLPDDVQPKVGIKRVGLVTYEFGPDGVKVEAVFPEAMTAHAYETVKAAYA
ncbi:3',5'-cyclic AMP phosphodiesterase CpdA [Devosia sp. UYZn731]|uniref:metallophosphoesterase family protein n=1 Tax=Devosia sp. UYZn731 TaxID=3156345 RepID=UPI00339AF606